MRSVRIILRREFGSYFATPLAYVFLALFLVLSNLFTFYVGGFFGRGQADLMSFFNYQPWLFLLLVPAISMKLWAEERRNGSIELLLTLPVTPWQAVLGKFLAAWAFMALALALTFPLWLTVNWLGNPDNGAILAAYAGCLLLAAAFLGVGSLASALTRSPVVAFIIAVAICFVLLMAGYPLVLDTVRGWAPQPLVNAVASLGFLTHFDAISRGVIEARDLWYFVLVTVYLLLVTTLALESRKTE